MPGAHGWSAGAIGATLSRERGGVALRRSLPSPGRPPGALPRVLPNGNAPEPCVYGIICLIISTKIRKVCAAWVVSVRDAGTV
jgi:hypothetical protein